MEDDISAQCSLDFHGNLARPQKYNVRQSANLAASLCLYRYKILHSVSILENATSKSFQKLSKTRPHFQLDHAEICSSQQSYAEGGTIRLSTHSLFKCSCMANQHAHSQTKGQERCAIIGCSLVQSRSIDNRGGLHKCSLARCLSYIFEQVVLAIVSHCQAICWLTCCSNS